MGRTRKQPRGESMIPFEEAFDCVMGHCSAPVKPENILLSESVGRILAEDVCADRDIPPFHRVAMDGYACRQQDLANPLTVMETVAAGQKPEKKIGPDQCAKVMTGCMLPRGADMVFMVEQSREIQPGMVTYTGDVKAPYSTNIARMGEDVQAGETVLAKGTLITPRHIAVLASVGKTHLSVNKRVTVGIISTGSEVVPTHDKPLPHQIRDANGPQLAAMVRQCGCICYEYGIAPDTPGLIADRVSKATQECDVILMTGGVSMGDFDLVPGILKEQGYTIHFDRIAVKPGKPTTFSTAENAVCFGLPGNPVSAFVMFTLMVKPYLYACMGHNPEPGSLCLALAEDWTRGKNSRTEWRPVTLTNDCKARLLPYHGSGHFHALSYAFGIAAIPRGTKHLNQGTLVNVRQI